jgi:hypothetical protein
MRLKTLSSVLLVLVLLLLSSLAFWSLPEKRTTKISTVFTSTTQNVYVGSETIYQGGTSGVSGAQEDDGTYENLYETIPWYYAESAAESTTTSTSYQDKVTLTFTPEDNSTYLIIASWLMANSSTSYQAKAKLTRTTGTAKDFNELIYQPKATSDYISGGAIGIDTFGTSPGPQTYKIQFCTNNASGTAKIKEARIFAIKLNSLDAYAQAENRTTTTSTSWQDKTTLTFTPPAQDNYLILAYATADGNSTSYDFKVQLTIDGTAYSTVNIRTVNSANRYPWAVSKVVNLTAASHTIKIQYCSSSSSGTAGIAHARIVALNLSRFQNRYYAENEARTTTTSTTYVDKLSLTQTPPAGDYLILGVAGLDEASTSYSAYAQMVRDTSSYGEMSIRPNSTSAQGHLYFSVKKETLSGASTTWKIQYKTSSSSYAAGIKDARIAVLRLPGYRMNIQHSVVGIPAADNYQLQVKYYTTGDSEPVSLYLYNFSTGVWDNIGNLQVGGSASSPYLFTYDLTGTGYISGGEVRVCFVQTNDDSTQTSLMVDYTRVVATVYVWKAVETWTGTVTAPASWKQVDAWTGTIEAPSPAIWKEVEAWQASLIATAEWKAVDSWTGALSSPVTWKEIETWTTAICSLAEWRLVESWLGTTSAPAEWKTVETWTATVHAPAEWRSIETWFATIFSPAEWKAIESWTGELLSPAGWKMVEVWQATLASVAEWKAIETWTGDLSSPAVWNAVEVWTGTVSSPAVWKVVETWTITTNAPAIWRAVESWATTVEAPAEWIAVETWTVTLSSPATWKAIETWTGTLFSPAAWKLAETWTGVLSSPATWNVADGWIGTLSAPAEWRAVETWQATFATVAEWSAVDSWTGALSSPASWREVESWRATLTAVAEWSTVEAWTVAVYSPAMWKAVETWTGAVFSPATWSAIETWTGGFSSPAEWREVEIWQTTLTATAEWRAAETWIVTLSSPTMWKTVETWTAATYAPAEWRLTETWFGEISSPAEWKAVETWSSTTNAPAIWDAIDSWMGTLSAPAKWSAIETWIGELSSPAGWKGIETWQATLTTTARWTAIDSWTGTLSSPAIWKTVETWTGTISPFWVWKAVETWTSTLSAPAEWKMVETWQVTLTSVGWKVVDSWTAILSSPSVWKSIETWSGTISSPAWKTVETWTGALSSLLAWRVVETWTSTVSAPTAPPPPPPPPVWQAVEAWTGTVASPLAKVTTEPATNIASSSATLNARIEYGVFGSVNIRFEFRMRGATEWLSTPWRENYTENTYSYFLAGLTPNSTYQYRAHITYDGFDNLGDVLEFTTKPIYIPMPPPPPPPIVYDVKAEVQPKEIPSGGTALLKINVYRVSGTEIIDIFVSYEVVGPKDQIYATEGWTEAFVSKFFELPISTARWPAGDYTVNVRVRYLDQEVSTSTTFKVMKPVAIERYLWLLALAVLALLFVLWRRYS